MSLFLGGLRTLRAPATRSLRRSYSTPHAAPAQGSDTPWLPSSTAPPAQAKSSESTNEEPQQKDGAQGAAASKSEGEDAPRDDAGVSAEVPREQGSGEKSAEGKQMPSKLNPKDPREIPSKRDEDKVEEK